MRPIARAATATGDLNRYCGPHGTDPVDQVVLAGDWHGDATWARHVIRTAGAAGHRLILHVGDFGIWPENGAIFRDQIEKTLRSENLVLLVTPGNHEWWDLIDALAPIDRGDGWGPVAWYTDHIGILPRGHRFTLTTTTGTPRSVVSLGGAPSIDFPWRYEGVNWWPSERITQRHVRDVIDRGTADIMLTHDSPDQPYAVPAVAKVLAQNPMGWPDRCLAYAKEGRDLITHAFEQVAPAVLAHGHFHETGEAHVDFVPGTGPGRDGGCLVIALDQQKQRGNVRVLDLRDLSTSDLPELR